MLCLVAGLMIATHTTMDLKNYRDKNRLLLLFGPSHKDPRFIKQNHALRKEGEHFRERELLRIDVFARDGILMGRRMEGPDAADLREQFNVNIDDFELILIGKDGGMKLRQRSPIDPAELYKLIDAMPMRRREIKERKAP